MTPIQDCFVYFCTKKNSFQFHMATLISSHKFSQRDQNFTSSSVLVLLPDKSLQNPFIYLKIFSEKKTPQLIKE